MEEARFNIGKRIRSFRFAFNGILILIRKEHNSRIHIFFAALAIFLGFVLKISSLEWCVIAFAIVSVFGAELFNSSIERSVDLITETKNNKAGEAKDMAAAAVLLTAIGAFVCGIIIFGPKLLEKLQ